MSRTRALITCVWGGLDAGVGVWGGVKRVCARVFISAPLLQPPLRDSDLLHLYVSPSIPLSLFLSPLPLSPSGYLLKRKHGEQEYIDDLRVLVDGGLQRVVLRSQVLHSVREPHHLDRCLKSIEIKVLLSSNESICC